MMCDAASVFIIDVAAGYHTPIIFLTGYGDMPLSVRAMHMGAVDFLEKPVDGQELLTAIDRALDTDCHRQDAQDDV